MNKIVQQNQVIEVKKLIKSVLLETERYKLSQRSQSKKDKGQFFTSDRTADFMAGLTETKKADFKILDPGAGNGLLALKVLAFLLESKPFQSISITYVEKDSEILPILFFVRNEIERINSIGPVNVVCNIENKNFILDKIEGYYDLVISNPPYFKIQKNSDEAKTMESFVYGQPNIYGLFIVKALQKLNDSGQFIFITPRSWTSGNYFKKIREFLFTKASIIHIHLFNVRDKVFSSENVLQETMVWSGIKKPFEQHNLVISTSENDYFHNMKSFTVNQDDILYGEDNRLFLPLDMNDYELLKTINQNRNTFDSLGYCFKTGPVVEFRNQTIISNHPLSNSIPMFRSLNVQNGRFIFPVMTNKAQYVDPIHNEALQIKNKPTIIVKRLSAKEEERRLQCCRYYPFSDDEFISMENHVNYLVRKDGASLSNDEIDWAYKIISSEQYDKYFRMFSGSTQVNAQDLNTLPVPIR